MFEARPSVLIVDLSACYGGSDVRVIELCRSIRERVDLTVAVLKGSGVEARLRQAGVALWPIARRKGDPRIILDLFQCLRARRPQSIDAHNPQSILWGLVAAWLARVPNRIVTIHSVYEESEKRRAGKLLFGALYGLVQLLATRVVVVSEYVRAHLLGTAIEPSKVVVIENGVVIRERIAWHREKDRCRIAIVGRLVPVKGHSALFRALERLSRRGHIIDCIVIGDGPARGKLEAEAKARGLSSQVSFLGFRADVQALLVTCDALIMPSLTEALPFAALEAAALGLPIVASSVGGLKLCFRDADTAKLVNPGSIDDLANAIVWCITCREEAVAMGTRARKMVSERFSVSRMIDQTLLLYARGEPVVGSRQQEFEQNAAG